MQSSLGSKTLSLLSPNDWRISNNESPPCDNESSTCNNESSPCVRSCTGSVRLREGETWGGTHTRSLVGPIVWKGSFRMVAKDTFWKFNEFLDLEFLFREGLWLNSIPIFSFFPSHFDVLQTARSRPHIYINQILQLVLFRKKNFRSLIGYTGFDSLALCLFLCLSRSGTFTSLTRSKFTFLSNLTKNQKN